MLITGAGPVGQGGIVNAKFRGARVIVSEPEPWRAERAKLLGADDVVDPRDEDVLAQVRALTDDGLGVTCSIDCAGVTASQRLCIDATRAHGTVVFVAESGTPLPITVSPDMIRKSLQLKGQWHYSLNDFDQMVRVLRSTGPQARPADQPSLPDEPGAGCAGAFGDARERQDPAGSVGVE